MEEQNTKTIIFVLGALVIFTSGIFLGRFLSTGAVLGGAETENSDAPAVPGAPGQPSQPEAGGKPIEEAGGTGTLPVKGDENAPVTMIEFSEYQCPFCSRYVEETFSKIKEDYIDTGKVKYYFRDFPLAFHQYAQKAAEASRCANEQGKFWEYHDRIFEEQDLLNLDKLEEWAEELGLDTDQFSQCLDEGKYEGAVKKDSLDGQTAGIKGTPSFFINGEMVRGAQPYDNFKKVIDEALAET